MTRGQPGRIRRSLCVLLTLGCALACSSSDTRSADSATRRGDAAERFPAAGRETPAPILHGVSDGERVPEWMRRAEELRGLEFQRSVEVRPLVRSEVARAIRAEIEAMMPPDQVEAYRDAYVALGVLPPGHDLVATFSNIYGAQMVGRYSRRERTLYLLEGDLRGGYSRETVAVHELVHALQDQHFGLTMALSEELRHNDDLVSALAGVIEGDATFTMLGAQDRDPTTERTLEAAEEFRSGMLQELTLDFGPLSQAPRLIQVSVIYPYAYGVVMAAHRYGQLGNRGLDDLLRNAPLSTLELLFSQPGRRQRTSVDFIELPLESWRESLAREGCQARHHNVAGSLTLRALFQDYGAPGSQGLESAWRGDRFVRVDCDTGTQLIWLSRWDSEASAARFVESYTSIAPVIAERAGLAAVPRALASGRSVVVRTPAMARWADELLAQPRIRSYVNFSSWLEQGCFGEGGGCPAGTSEGISEPSASEGTP